MGRYMKKSKIAGEIAVMDVSQTTTTFGFRTRSAKSLALQRLRSLCPSPATPVEADSLRYLQLRSRRLEKPSLLTESRRQPKHQQLRRRVCKREARNPRAKPGSVKSGSRAVATAPENKGDIGKNEGTGGSDTDFDGALSGENSFDLESRARNTRESTPCNLVSDIETVRTPGSTTRRISHVRTHERAHDGSLGIVPSSGEIEEFFENAEQQEQRFFAQK